jgi:hypothetical protein
VVIERDPRDGHPTVIRIDESADAADDETCYTVSDYTASGYPIGGTPGPEPSATR